ncbi:MAG TPA: GNAT family N-acetyltransferase [Solirubrobacteraceae bacterium]|nr:GNAT family N-acetyltransferase [Solirubrobacteraceae bacterium]
MASPDWKIRSASSADADGVLELWAAAGVPSGISDTPEGIASLLDDDPHALLLAESREALIGSLIAAWDGWRGSFYRLAVEPDRRREGIATALLREGERRLRDRGALRLTAIVTEDDAPALAFWAAAGYSLQPNRVRLLRHLDAGGAPTDR